jgi:hypothetical protein
MIVDYFCLFTDGMNIPIQILFNTGDICIKLFDATRLTL